MARPSRSQTPRQGIQLAIEQHYANGGYRNQGEIVEEILDIAQRLARENPHVYGYLAEETLSVGGYRYWLQARPPGGSCGIDEKWNPVLEQLLNVSTAQLAEIRAGMSGPKATEVMAERIERVIGDDPAATTVAELYARGEQKDAALHEAIDVLRGIGAVPEEIAKLRAELQETRAKYELELAAQRVSLGKLRKAVERLESAVSGGGTGRRRS